MAEVKDFVEEKKRKEEKVNTLSDNDRQKLEEKLAEIRSENPTFQQLEKMPSNNGILERDPSTITEQGEEVTGKVMINPTTGENVFIGLDEEEDPDFITDEDIDAAFDRMVDTGDNIDDRPVSMEELQVSLKEDMTLFEDVTLSMKGAADLLILVNNVIKGQDFNYRSLPEEVQKAIDLYMKRNGMAGYSVQSNEVRNSITKMLIEGFTQDVMMKRYITDFSTEMENIMKETGEEISSMYAEYNNERVEKMNAYLDKIDDPEKKEKLKNILDAINDGFDLNRLKDAAREHKIKIKKFDIEKPKRAIDRFLYKYEKSTQNIYSPWLAMQVLHRNAPDIPVDDINLFFVALVKYCEPLPISDTPSHAFTYYALYNCVQMDILKGEKHITFKEKFVNNVKEVIELLKEK